MLKKKAICFLFVVLSLLGNHATTAQPNSNACVNPVNHNLFEIGQEVNITISAVKDENYGYLKIHFGSDAGIYAGTTATGWCVDIGRFIGTGTYQVDSYSTYDNVSIPSGAVDKPQNLDLINWFVNKYYIGKTVTPGNGCPSTVLTWREIQKSIWTIIDDDAIPNTGASQCIVDYMVNDAYLNGNNFEPCCADNDKMAALLVVDNDTTGQITNQVIIAEMPLQNVNNACPTRPPTPQPTLSPTPYPTNPPTPQPTPTPTPMPTNSPTRPPTRSAIVRGDPHFKTWAGDKYDFHGVCDLVLLKNPDFMNGLGVEIHIRTQKTRSWSYIHSTALRIGSDTFEVMGNKNENYFWKNQIRGLVSDFPLVLSGFPVLFKQLSSKSRQFVINLGAGQMIVIKTWNSMVSVAINIENGIQFDSSLGLMGTFPAGLRMARDNSTLINDVNAFGQEWQVRSSEPMLFHDINGPQYPEKCEVPSMSQMRRRLGESVISTIDAQIACARVSKEDLDLCVFDVVATNDKDAAGAY